MPLGSSSLSRDFILLLLGRGVSSLGDYFGELALSFFVYTDTNSPFLLGITFASFAAPRSFARLFGGVYVDRVNRRALMIATELIRGILFAILAFLQFLGKLSVYFVYPSLIVVGGLGALFEMTSDAFMPQIVERDTLFKANSLLTAVLNIDSIFGPALAGLSIYFIGTATSMMIDSISFFVLVVALLLIRNVKIEVMNKERNWLNEFKTGISFFKERKELLWLATTYSITNFGLAGFWNVYLLVFSLNVLHAGSIGWGFLNAVSSAGIVLMAAILARRGEIKERRSAIIISVYAIALFVALLALTNNIILSSIVMFMLGVSIPISAVILSAYYQRTVPKEQLGRVLAFRNLINYVSIPFGVIFGGLILYHVTVQQALIITSLIIILGCMIPTLKKSISKIDVDN
jgi:MFS family permease